MKTLHLTSPHMKGPDVKRVQELLEGVGVLRHRDVDGEFGPVTAAACVLVKKRLGYPKSGQKPTAGQTLVNYLTGTDELPAAYKLRRKLRGSQDGPTGRELEARKTAIRALGNLRTKIGTKESPPGSNRCWATAWYGLVGPWCAMSVSWAYSTAGSTTFVRGSRYAYVPFIVADARAGQNGLMVTNDPVPGDLVCYDWQHDGTADHVGLFERWTNQAAGEFDAIEGNTGIGNDSNGGEVMRRSRSRTLVQAFVKVTG